MGSINGRCYVPHRGRERNASSANKSQRYRTGTKGNDARRQAADLFPVRSLLARYQAARSVTSQHGSGGYR
jgi:hypothetical protein